MNKKSILIIVVLSVLLVVSVSLLVYCNYKLNSVKPVWCNTAGTYDVVEGKIIYLSSDSFLINMQDGKEMEIRHDSFVNFEAGQRVKVAYDGMVLDSQPPLINAICIEVVE